MAVCRIWWPQLARWKQGAIPRLHSSPVLWPSTPAFHGLSPQNVNFLLLRWNVKAWVAWQVLALLVLSQCFALNSTQRIGTWQKVASGSLCALRSRVLGQAELPSGRSLGDAERPVEELPITLGMGTEEEGRRSKQSNRTDTMRQEHCTDSVWEKQTIMFLDGASWSSNSLTRLGIYTLAFAAAFQSIFVWW